MKNYVLLHVVFLFCVLNFMVKNIFLAIVKLNCQIFFLFQIIIQKYLNLILTNKNFGIKITKEIFIDVDIY